jgi:hypothetical protein
VTSTAKIAAIVVFATSPAMRNRRRSTMSASAPAGMAIRKIGRPAATCTSETISGSGLSPVISQAEAAVYIQVPRLATTVAVQITAKAGWRNGLHGELAEAGRGDGSSRAVTSRPLRGAHDLTRKCRRSASC